MHVKCSVVNWILTFPTSSVDSVQRKEKTDLVKSILAETEVSDLCKNLFIVMAENGALNKVGLIPFWIDSLPVIVPLHYLYHSVPIIGYDRWNNIPHYTQTENN